MSLPDLRDRTTHRFVVFQDDEFLACFYNKDNSVAYAEFLISEDPGSSVWIQTTQNVQTSQERQVQGVPQ